MNEMFYKLNRYKRLLTTQQYKTLKGQIIAGDPMGAERGLKRIIHKKFQKVNKPHLKSEKS